MQYVRELKEYAKCKIDESRVNRSDIAGIIKRKKTLSELQDIIGEITDLMETLTDEIVEVEEIQSTDLRNLENVIDVIRSGTTMPTPEINSELTELLKEGSIIDVPKGKYKIKAVHTSSLRNVKADGRVYYIAEYDTFAWKLWDQLYYGNIGDIYTHDPKPIRVRECKWKGDCVRKDCNYWHSPIHNSKIKKYTYTRNWLITDINNISASTLDVNMYYSDKQKMILRVSHDTLCTLLHK